MPFNGAGVYSPPGANYPAVSLTVITAANRNAIDSDIATALSLCITKDGQQTVTADIPMANHKFTGLGLGISATDSARVSNANSLHLCEFRLTLTTGVPVTTADITAAGTVFITPYRGNRVALFDGTNWNMRSSTEGAIVTGSLAASTVYDVFLLDNAGTPASEVLAWTNDTTRATALTTQDGVLVKSGAPTRRYLGSFRTDGSKNVNDAYHLRHVWNYYNRVQRGMRKIQADAGYNYTTATWRQANANTANQIDFLVGVAEDAVTARAFQLAKNATLTANWAVGIGVDSTSSIDVGNINTQVFSDGTAAVIGLNAFLNTIPAAGRHFYSLNEWSAAIGTTSWAQGNGFGQSGIMGEMWG